MNYILSLLFVLIVPFLSSETFAQETTKDNDSPYHNLEKCNKCKCFEWHQESSIDSTDQTQIIHKWRLKKGSRGQCGKDGLNKYHWITLSYHPNEKIKEKEIEKGWNNGFTGSYNRKTTNYSERSGKKLWQRIKIKQRGIVKLEKYREFDND